MTVFLSLREKLLVKNKISIKKPPLKTREKLSRGDFLVCLKKLSINNQVNPTVMPIAL